MGTDIAVAVVVVVFNLDGNTLLDFIIEVDVFSLNTSR
jgi:hypothetical protein